MVNGGFSMFSSVLLGFGFRSLTEHLCEVREKDRNLIT
jgi:hypothetical protein